MMAGYAFHVRLFHSLLFAGFHRRFPHVPHLPSLTLYSVKEREPLAFAKQPGNVPDVISIENTLKQLQCLNLQRPLIVTDNGYYSEENMMKFALRNMKFLTLADPNVTWVRQTVDALRQTLTSMSSTCPFDPSVCVNRDDIYLINSHRVLLIK